MDTPKYCNFAFISLNKTLLESPEWNTLTLKQIRVFIYLYSCLQWTVNKKQWIVLNNGDISVSTIKMRNKLGISKQTCSKAIHKLIEVGLIRLTRIGENKVCHQYKILYNIVPQREERWKKYPDKDWLHECPKRPNMLVGKSTQFKSDPKKVAHKSNKQPNEFDLEGTNNQVKLTHNDVIDDDKQSSSLGSIIYNHIDLDE